MNNMSPVNDFYFGMLKYCSDVNVATYYLEAHDQPGGEFTEPVLLHNINICYPEATVYVSKEAKAKFDELSKSGFHVSQTPDGCAGIWWDYKTLDKIIDSVGYMMAKATGCAP